MLGTKSYRLFALMGALLIVVALAAVACGGDEPEPAEPALSEDQLRSIVEDAVAKSIPEPQQQVSAEEIQAMVEKAVMEAGSSQISADEIMEMVQGAVAMAAAQGASPEEIQAMVEKAVMAATAEGVTSEDVQSAISMAVMEAQEGAVTSEQVQAAVEKAAESAAMQVAENSLTAEEIQGIVSKALEERAMMEEVTRETIVFSDLNWTSAQVQNRIAQYIVEHGYGYPTDTIFGGTLPNFQGLLAGDIHVTLEIWLPNQSLGWEQAIEVGNVVSVGTSLVGDWQSYFVVPQYIADAYPDLQTPQDLKLDKFQELFATADSRGKARLVGCLVDWSCEASGRQQIEAYGLNDYVEIITPGSGDALFADLNAAYEKGDPWLGYMWGTGDPAFELDLFRLEEPPYTKECWDTDKACGFADSLVLVAVHESLLPRAPDVVGMLQNWEFTVPTYFDVLRWMNENEGSEPIDGAIWFLTNNKVWESWVTPEAAARVNAELAAGS